MSKAILYQTTQGAPKQVSPLRASAGGVDLTAGEALQQIRGFGGCFNELGWYALQKLPKNRQEELFQALFGAEGCDFGYCRLPIGASDFARSWYSLDETPGDYELEHFSLERDREALIPYIRRAMAVKPELRLFASPWSPPTWLKEPPVYNHGSLAEDERSRKTYARYLLKFVREYRREGIPVEAVHIQNEPASRQKFPSCQWTGEQLRRFIREDVGPLFEENGNPAELWLGTINAPYEDFGGEEWQSFGFHRMADTVLRDDEARRYLAGVGYQWGGKHAIGETHRVWPDIELIQTEGECGDGRNTWSYMEYLFHLMWHFFEHGVTAYVDWNMLLQQGGASSWGWNQNSLFCEAEGELVCNPEYWLMWHTAHFVRPGARFLRSEGNRCGNALCFRNPDGSEAAVLLNPLGTAAVVRLRLGGGEYEAELAPHSLSTAYVLGNR